MEALTNVVMFMLFGGRMMDVFGTMDRMGVNWDSVDFLFNYIGNFYFDWDFVRFRNFDFFLDRNFDIFHFWDLFYMVFMVHVVWCLNFKVFTKRRRMK